MAAPATTARVSPVGIPYKDGFSTKIACALDADISFWEKTVQPLGLDGGDAVDNTTMHNVTYTTFRSQTLITSQEVALTAAYDESAYDQIIAIINSETSWTIHFPDGATLDFYGFLRSFLPQNNERASQPEANIVIQPIDWDPVNAVEQGPVLTAVAGT